MPNELGAPRYADGIRKRTVDVFGGLDRSRACSDGGIVHMENMSGDAYPLASPRRGRQHLVSFDNPNGIHTSDGIYIAAGTGFYRFEDGLVTELGKLTDTKKVFATIGSKIVIFPDKCYYDKVDDEFGSLEASWSGTASFTDGEYAGVEAEACRIVTTGARFPFKVGDAVTVEGADDDENNTTLIVREISSDGKSLGFYEHSFTNAKSQTLTISRAVPDMDFILENENRLWGCKGDTIYASVPEDPTNFNVFDGLASDAYAVNVVSNGDFTAACSYLGYPIFFKEDKVYKVYGSKPSDYQVMSSASLGVKRGSASSLAVAGEVLYYLSVAGIMAYTGGVPSVVSGALCDDVLTAVGGSDGLRYYAYLTLSDGSGGVFVYDTRRGQWYREDDTSVCAFAREVSLYMLTDDGGLYMVNAPEAVGYEVSSVLEFGDFIENSPSYKSTAKIQMRIELEEGASVKVEMSFDGGAYEEKYVIDKPGKRSYYIPIAPARCDHFRVRLCGIGRWYLYSLTREASIGSDKY